MEYVAVDFGHGVFYVEDQDGNSVRNDEGSVVLFKSAAHAVEYADALNRQPSVPKR